ncbi:MAG: HEAT repeat domain-containing protein, partial [Verrucomicrobiae bacterium]|nr:HEAT repeat domain-containing protein [Verrucomicrobiae bacterium]
MSAALRLFLITGIVLMILAISIYALRHFESRPGTSSSGNSGTAVTLNRKPEDQKNEKKSGWVPPEGDPVQRFRELKNGTPQERKDLISNFMALGHERNPDMLIEALKDPDTDVRVFAIESASALTEEESTRVLQAAAANDNPDAREMAWSIAAPYPIPSKVKIYGEALAKGSDANVEEAFEEMSITPEMPLFEMMIYHTLDPNLPDSRKQRLLKEMQLWLEPGGGDVPTFSDPKDLFEWWKA